MFLGALSISDGNKKRGNQDKKMQILKAVACERTVVLKLLTRTFPFRL